MTTTKTILRGYKFQIIPTEEQKEFFSKSFGSSRFVYNHFLNVRKNLYLDAKKSLSYSKLCIELTKLKSDKEFIWLNEINSQSLQQSLRQLDVAYTRFFKKTSAFPTFKSKYDDQSFVIPQHFKLEGNLLYIPKLKKPIKVNNHREFGDNHKICFVIISKTKTNKYFVSYCVEEEFKSEVKKTDSKIGIDLGLIDLMTFSDGTKVTNPKIAKKYRSKLIYQQRQHSKKKKEGKNKEKARLKLANTYEKITNVKQDYTHKLTSNIIKNHDVIVMENLSITNMMKNHKLARSIQDVSWYEIVRQLKYKSEWNDRQFIQIDRFFPSSKTCNNCNYINQALKMSDRSWKCPNCQVEMDRDYNASLNIIKQGLSGLGIKSDVKQKHMEASATISGQPEKIVESMKYEAPTALASA